MHAKGAPESSGAPLANHLRGGIVLSAPLVARLALARADVDIDQYVFHECEESADA